MTDWNAWSRIVEAAQDPRRRDAVQKYLAQAELSGETPAALDARFLSPRRSAGATGEQCAYILSNLGFAALVAGTGESAEFAIGCGRLVEQLAPESPDLALRRHFMMTKGSLLLAVLTAQPHLRWSNAARRCVGYLGCIEKNLEALPAEGIEANAMAAYSFTAQLLSRVGENRAVAYYAGEVSDLVDVALQLADRLPSAFAARMWPGIMPGTDAGLFFRQVGAVAERALQSADESPVHSRKGIAYADEVLSRLQGQAALDAAPVMRTRAELLLSSGRNTEAMDQADTMEKLSDSVCQAQAVVLRARNHLERGEPQAAAELLARVSPSVDRALENWAATWMEDVADGYWTHRAGGWPASENDQEIWRLQAVAAADLDDMVAFREAADRATGFLAAALLQDRRHWAERMRAASSGQASGADRSIRPGIASVEPMPALEDVFAHLADGAALLQVVDTEEGILTWTARKRAGQITQSIAPDRPNSARLRAAHKAWSGTCLEAGRREAGFSGHETDRADACAGLLDEVRGVWGNLLHELVTDGVSQLILVGDDLIDIPLHATRLGTGDERLIDRVPVTYVPSLFALRTGIARDPVEAGPRQSLQLRNLAEGEPDSAEALAEILQSKPVRMIPPVDDAFWAGAAAAQVLHIDADVTHNPRRPIDSTLGTGWLDLSFARLQERLDLPRCEIVSILSGETALPTMLRAPGFDLATIFLAAGARNVLASTWLAGDELAFDLLQSFIRRWVTGQAPSAAFRDALLKIRSDRPALADSEWAGMRIVGGP